MKSLLFSLIFTLSGFFSFSQKNVDLFATDFYGFNMTIDELIYFMNTDSTMNKWSYMESYGSDYFMVFNINFKENNVIYSQNTNGVFINLTNIDDDILDKIVKYLNYTDSRNSEIDSEFYNKVLT